MNPQVIEIGCLVNGGSAQQHGKLNTKALGQYDAKRVFSQFFCKAMNGEKDMSPSSTEKKTFLEGEDWMAVFRNRLLSEDLAVEKTSLSGSARSVLRRLLVGDGASESDVDAFLEKLFNGETKREIALPEFLEKISLFRAEQTQKCREAGFELSDLPHLETLLRALGMEVKEVERAIEESRKENVFSFKKIVEQLQKTQKTAPAVFENNDTAGKTESDERVRALLARIGLEKEAAEIKGSITLDDFRRIVENKTTSSKPSRLSEVRVEKEVKGLVDSLLVSTDLSVSKRDGTLKQVRRFDGFTSEAPAEHKQQESKNALHEVHHRKIQAEQSDRDTEQLKGDGEKREDLFAKIEKSGVGSRKVDSAKVAEKQDAGTRPDLVHEAGPGRSSPLEMPLKEIPRPVPLHVVHQVARQLGTALKRGENQIRVQLNPPDLGSIQLDMAMKNNVLKVAIVSEHHAVKELLVSHVHELKEALLEQGIELQSVDVQIDYNFSQSMANAQKGLDRSHPWRHHEVFEPEGGEDVADEVAVGMHQTASTGSLDMFA